MKQKSDKQKRKDAELSKIKGSLKRVCAICGKHGYVEGAHLLPRSLFPEYYTKPENIVPLCHECHQLYDNDISFRKKQAKLIKRVQSFDRLAANKHFRLYE